MRISAWFRLDSDPPTGAQRIILRFSQQPLFSIVIRNEGGIKQFGVYYSPDNRWLHKFGLPGFNFWSYFFYEISWKKSALAVRAGANAFNEEDGQEQVELSKRITFGY